MLPFFTLEYLAAIQGDNHASGRDWSLTGSVRQSPGDRHHQAALHNNLADLLHAVGQSDAAMAHLKQAVAIFAEIDEASTLQPEIWKLVEW